jgi:hypothetical protein
MMNQIQRLIGVYCATVRLLRQEHLLEGGLIDKSASFINQGKKTNHALLIQIRLNCFQRFFKISRKAASNKTTFSRRLL